MNLTLIEWVWLDASETMTLDELSNCCGISPTDLEELVEYSALVALQPATEPPTFSAEWVTPLRTAAKLRSDFDLDLFSVALLLGHMNSIEVLERKIKSLQALALTHSLP